MLGRLYAAKYRYLFGRLFNRFSGLQNAASAVDILCPEETTVGEPAVYLDGQLDKVTGVQEETTIDYEMGRIRGGRRIHAPTIVYCVDSVSLLDGTFYKGRHKSVFPMASLDTVGDKEPKRLRSAALAASYSGVKYFGHWVRDDCATYLLARDRGQPLSVRLPDWPDKGPYARLFEQDWTPTDRAFIDELTVFQDFSQNSSKRKRYEILRQRVRRRVQPVNPGGIVYMRRGTGGVPRVLENEDDLVEALAKRGVVILTAEDGPLETMLAALLEARVFITVEGSQQDHGIFGLCDGGAVIALQPPLRFNNVTKDWTECLGMRYGFVVGEPSEKGFTIDASDVLRTLDLVT